MTDDDRDEEITLQETVVLPKALPNCSNVPKVSSLVAEIRMTSNNFITGLNDEYEKEKMLIKIFRFVRTQD